MAEADTRSLVAVIHDRYGFTELDMNIVVSKGASSKTESGRLVLPPNLGLNHQNISSVGDFEELADLCKSVLEIDLANNNISDWMEILQLIETLPQLQFLNVMDNPLCKNDYQRLSDILAHYDDSRRETLARSKITKLVLNDLDIGWEDVWAMLKLLPRVQELHLCRNNFTSVEAPGDDTTFPGVTAVFLNKNKLKEWEDLERVGRIFPSLKNFVVLGNPVQILCSDSASCERSFPELVNLNLSRSSIDSWEQLETLRSWPRLVDVRVQETPLFESFPEEMRRQLFVAYLPTVTRLNGSPVTAAEREDAERCFIRHYMGKDIKPKRYEELHSVYGDLDPLVDVRMKTQQSVTVSVHYNKQSFLRTLDVRWTLVQLKKEILKAWSFADPVPSTLRCFHQDVGAPYGKIEMKYGTRTVLGYRIKDGDELHVY